MDEITQFCEKHKLSKFTKEATDSQNSLVSILKIEFVIKTLPGKIILKQDDFSSNFYQIFKEEIIPFLHNFFQKTEGKGTFPLHFMRATLPQYQYQTKTLL